MIAWSRHDGLNQKWEICYVDICRPEPTSGLATDWGLYINRPFYIHSALPDLRMIDLVGRNAVIKTRNGYKTQQWIFEYKTRTIKSMHNKGWSLEIAGNGKNTNVQAMNTNSKWW